jgi:hypothetical protein
MNCHGPVTAFSDEALTGALFFIIKSLIYTYPFTQWRLGAEKGILFKLKHPWTFPNLQLMQSQHPDLDRAPPPLALHL